MNKQLFALALLGISATIAPAAFAQATVTAAKPTANPIAADVNGEKILTSDLNRVVEAVQQSDPGLKTNTPAAQKALADLRVQLLDEMIETRLLLQEAKKRKITPQAATVDAALKSFRDANFKTEPEFTAWLKSDNKTVADLKRLIADELAMRELSTQLAADVVVSNDDIAAFYRTNLDKFTQPEGVKAHHILLAINPDAPTAEKARVKARAEALKKQIKGGADFVTLAKTNSDEPAAKQTGGDLGAFPRGAMVKAFEDAAFAAKKGEIVGPVETQFGVHIIKVDDKIAPKVAPLAEVQKDPRVKAFLLKQKVQKRLDDKIAEFKKSSKIQKFA